GRLLREEGARGRALRPRYGKSHAAAGPRRNVGKGIAASGPQHAPDLAIETVAVGDVHDGVLRPNQIEGLIREFHRERVAVMIVDLCLEPRAARQHRCRLDKGGGEIDAGDVAAEPGSEIARWPAEARA